MPHIIFETGTLSATDDALGARPLIPGVEPGGSRVGAPTKPVLLLKEAYMVVNDLVVTANDEFWKVHVDLKLSKENTLVPGLLLDVGNVMGGIATADNAASSMVQHDEFAARGTIWAAAFIGLRVELVNVASINLGIHVDYEAVDIDWMSWFIRWDFLDNVVNNDRDY